MIKNYENLALQGGGVWGISYAGAFKELDRLGVLGQIRRVAETSAGSMAGLLFFTAVEIAGQIFVDGGIVFDYPLVGFGQDEIGNTLGLAFAQSSVVAMEDLIDTGRVNSLNFKLTKGEKERLVTNGRQVVRQYFDGKNDK